MAETIRNNIAKAQKDAMERHNAIMASIQQSMGGGMGGFGAPVAPFGSAEPKMYSDGFDDWMRNHIRMMNEMMRMQNAQIQALQQLISSSPSYRKTPTYHYSSSSAQIRPTEIRYQNPKTVDGEARSPRDSGNRHHNDD
ncbi:hypothetical protein GCK72_017307 [Caenorhabditis remanei]|uniref:Uncharacterized protein n=1 Tax=Caenorhabditis remanei TaxID=31234 RepID=A0A6A5G7E0_CAERE|nr:hypothetical protein GCK72_017307 [Caenorhabditis remanei]KAF1750756.1 hypothetical protein GCK72_017307 [Caenorhabditis remanei]